MMKCFQLSEASDVSSSERDFIDERVEQTRQAGKANQVSEEQSSKSGILLITNKYDKKENISKFRHDKRRGLDSEDSQTNKKSQARDISRIVLTDTNIKKKKGSQKSVTGMVRNFSLDINSYNKDNYINLSVNNNNIVEAEFAAVTRMVRGLSYKQFLLSGRIPGSIPISSSDFLLNFNQKTKVKTFGSGASPVFEILNGINKEVK